MRNRLDVSLAKLKLKLMSARSGALKNSAALSLPSEMAVTMTTSHDDIIVADTAYEMAKEKLRETRAELKSRLKEAYDFATLMRDMQRRKIGTHYSQSWDALGFAGSLRIPRHAAGLVDVLESMFDYLTKWPDSGSSDLKITAARASELIVALRAAQNAVNVQKTARIRSYEARTTCMAEARTNLRWVINELTRKIRSTDSRWLEFGLNRPGNKIVPEAPAEVVVTRVSSNNAAVRWEKSPHAERYRIWIRSRGADAPFTAIGSALDQDFEISDVPVDGEIEIGVTAVNVAGESKLSQPVVIKLSAASV